MTFLVSGIEAVVWRAFRPVIEVAQAISYPVAYLMFVASFVVLMLGHKSKGLAMAKWTVIGYLLMRFVPFIMQLLATIGDEMSKAVMP